ncbi:hypothetical protein [Kribbella endophytica]
MGIDRSGPPAATTRLSIDGLLAAKHTRPIGSVDDLAAETFASDDELDELLAFTAAERRREVG